MEWANLRRRTGDGPTTLPVERLRQLEQHLRGRYWRLIDEAPSFVQACFERYGEPDKGALLLRAPERFWQRYAAGSEGPFAEMIPPEYRFWSSLESGLEPLPEPWGPLLEEFMQLTAMPASKLELRD